MSEKKSRVAEQRNPIISGIGTAQGGAVEVADQGGGKSTELPDDNARVDLDKFVQDAVDAGFVFDKRMRLEPHSWVQGRFLRMSSAKINGIEERALPTGEVVKVTVEREVPTVIIEIAVGVNAEYLASYEIDRRFRQPDMVPGGTLVLIKRGGTVETRAGRRVSEYDIGVKHPPKVPAAQLGAAPASPQLEGGEKSTGNPAA